MKSNQFVASSQPADTTEQTYQVPSFEVTDLIEVVKLENGVGSLTHTPA